MIVEDGGGRCRSENYRRSNYRDANEVLNLNAATLGYWKTGMRAESSLERKASGGKRVGHELLAPILRGREHFDMQWPGAYRDRPWTMWGKPWIPCCTLQ